MSFMSLRLFVCAVCVALTAAVAPPALALGQVIIFRDAELTERYRRMAAHLTHLQMRVAVEQDATTLQRELLSCRGEVQQVFAPKQGQLDPDACRVIVTLKQIPGFRPAESLSLAYWVQQIRAIRLKRGDPITLRGQLYALEPNGAVAIELEAPKGWLDVITPEPLPPHPKKH
jgi:hypothetical protein